jgi:hypothetical protein
MYEDWGAENSRLVAAADAAIETKLTLWKRLLCSPTDPYLSNQVWDAAELAENACRTLYHHGKAHLQNVGKFR